MYKMHELEKGIEYLVKASQILKDIDPKTSNSILSLAKAYIDSIPISPIVNYQDQINNLTEELLNNE